MCAHHYRSMAVLPSNQLSVDPENFMFNMGQHGQNYEPDIATKRRYRQSMPEFRTLYNNYNQSDNYHTIAGGNFAHQDLACVQYLDPEYCTKNNEWMRNQAGFYQLEMTGVYVKPDLMEENKSYPAGVGT